MAYEAMRNFDGAKTQFEAAIRCNRNIPVSYVKLGMLYAKMGNLAEAEKELEAITQVAPQDLERRETWSLFVKPGVGTGSRRGACNCGYLWQPGGFQASLGNWARSASWTEKAIQLQPGNAAYHLNLGVALKGFRSSMLPSVSSNEPSSAIACFLCLTASSVYFTRKWVI